jgi:hypothetical protein
LQAFVILIEIRIEFDDFFARNETYFSVFRLYIIPFFLRCDARKIYGDRQKEDDVKKPHCR